MEYNIIAGYREADIPEDRQWFVLANAPITDWNGAWLTWEQINKLNQDCPWSKHRCRYARHREAWSKKETVQHIVQWVVAWSETHPAADSAAYQDSLFGFKAIAAYAEDLGDLTKSVDKDFTFGNNACHAITPQWNTRRYIGEYLAAHATLFEGPAREWIQKAAAHYHHAYASWAVFDDLLGQCFVRKYGGKQKEGWADPERRVKGAAAVYEALEHEKAAIALLGESLSALA